jgi:hypothetical protein
VATYGVDIEIGVKGQQKLQDLSRQVKQLGRATDLVAESLGKKGKVSQSVENYNQVLQRTEKTLRTVIAGTKAETKAIQQYAQALNDVIAIEQRQQKLVRAAFRATPAGQAELELTKARKSLEISRRQKDLRLQQADEERALSQFQEQKVAQQAKEFQAQKEKNLALKKELETVTRVVQMNQQLAQMSAGATLKNEQARAIAAAQGTERLVKEQAAQRLAQAVKESAKTVFNKNLELALLTKIVGKTGEQGLLQKQINETQQRMIRDGQALLAQKERALAADKKSADFAALQRKRGFGGAISSGLIGGGFPLLFGQGGPSAVGGAIGGFAGGALGGGFGFALSVVGTALGQAIEKSQEFKKSLDSLNNTLKTSKNDTQFFKEDIDRLAESLGVAKDKALEIAQSFAFLGDKTLTGQAAAIFGDNKSLFDAVAAIKDQASFASALEQALGRLNKDEVARVLELGKGKTLLEQQNLLVDALNKKAGKQVVTSERQRRLAARRPGFKPETTLVPAVPELAGQGSALFAELSPLLQLLGELQKTPSGSKADPTPNLEKRLGIVNAQIKAEQEVVGLSSEGAAIVRRKLALEKRIAQIRETGKAERQKLTDLEDISLSKIIETNAAKLATLQFERDIAVAVERSATASEKTLEPVQRKLDALKDRNAFEREYGELIMSGSTTAAAKQVIEAKKQVKEIDELVKKQLRSNEIQINILRVIVAQTIGTDAHAAAQEALNDALERENEIREKGKKAKGEVKGKKTPRENIEEERKRVKAALNDLIDPANQVILAAQAIGDAFSESFRGLITGSMSAQEALANLFQRTADHFADMAAQMIAKAIQMKILGIALSFFNPSGGGGASSVPGSAYGDMSVAGPDFFSGGMIPGYAEGGYVSGPTRALVGEGGQGEYLIPENKMRESMARYSRGARGSAVIPETGGSGTSGEGGGTAVAAPIDVRYTVERINNVDYVTAEQFQAGMRQAANQGAKQGEQQTLKRLQMSGSTRKRLGM